LINILGGLCLIIPGFLVINGELRGLMAFLFRRAGNRSFPIDKSSWDGGIRAGGRRAINARSKEAMKVECRPIGKQLRR